jgi:hypothetical protein
MTNTFVEARQALLQIIADTVAHNSTVDQSIDRITTSHAQLDAMGSKWKSTIDFINDSAAADPRDPAWASMKSEANKVVSDFVAMRNRAAVIRDAAIAAK